MKTKKQFDCVAMKRHIQEKIYKDTLRMNHEEFRAYVREKIAKSQFRAFIEKPASNATQE